MIVVDNVTAVNRPVVKSFAMNDLLIDVTETWFNCVCFIQVIHYIQ